MCAATTPASLERHPGPTAEGLHTGGVSCTALHFYTTNTMTLHAPAVIWTTPVNAVNLFLLSRLATLYGHWEWCFLPAAHMLSRLLFGITVLHMLLWLYVMTAHALYTLTNADGANLLVSMF